MPAACPICFEMLAEGERFVLVGRGRELVHCSEACLVENVRRRRRARAASIRRWSLWAGAAAAVLIAAPQLWHRIRVPRAQTIVYDAPPFHPPPPARPEPIYEGPAWPPTDQDWLTAFARTAWVYPLPGPARRAPRADDRILAPRLSTMHAPPACRTSHRCGVDLGGELWGEHVYAVHDGVVDHVQRALDERGDVYLRLSHFGGMVFTHYVHLAAVPRTITRGTVVKAGELIGLVGDMGDEHPGRYVHFALSVRPSPALPEVYWDPTELMANWPLRLPSHGTVAGFVPNESDLAIPSVRHRLR